MLSNAEIIGSIAAMVATVPIALFIRKFTRGIEDTQSKIRNNDTDSPPVAPAKPVRPMIPRRKKRR
jgi:hypothetical protein